MEGSEAFNGFPRVGVRGRGGGRVVCVLGGWGGGAVGGGQRRGQTLSTGLRHPLKEDAGKRRSSEQQQV